LTELCRGTPAKAKFSQTFILRIQKFKKKLMISKIFGTAQYFNKMVFLILIKLNLN